MRAVCQTYLLEKSRVISHSTGERNFHVLHLILDLPDEAMEALKLDSNHRYNCLIGDDERRGESPDPADFELPRDASDLQVVLETLPKLGVSDADVLGLQQVLAAMGLIWSLVWIELSCLSTSG